MKEFLSEREYFIKSLHKGKHVYYKGKEVVINKIILNDKWQPEEVITTQGELIKVKDLSEVKRLKHQSINQLVKNTERLKKREFYQQMNNLNKSIRGKWLGD